LGYTAARAARRALAAHAGALPAPRGSVVGQSRPRRRRDALARRSGRLRGPSGGRPGDDRALRRLRALLLRCLSSDVAARAGLSGAARGLQPLPPPQPPQPLRRRLRRLGRAHPPPFRRLSAPPTSRAPERTTSEADPREDGHRPGAGFTAGERIFASRARPRLHGGPALSPGRSPSSGCADENSAKATKGPMRDLALDAVVGHLPKVARSIESGYLELPSWLEAHLPRISTLITATILSFYGRVVTDRTRQLAQDWPFILRLALFVSVGLGFSLLIASASPLIAAGLKL